MDETKPTAAAAKKPEPRPEPKPEPPPLRSYRVTVRHSPLVVKSAVVEAASETAAYERFLDINRARAADVAARRQKSNAPRDVEHFARHREQYDVTITPG